MCSYLHVLNWLGHSWRQSLYGNQSFLGNSKKERYGVVWRKELPVIDVYTVILSFIPPWLYSYECTVEYYTRTAILFQWMHQKEIDSGILPRLDQGLGLLELLTVIPGNHYMSLCSQVLNSHSTTTDLLLLFKKYFWFLTKNRMEHSGLSNR